MNKNNKSNKSNSGGSNLIKSPTTSLSSMNVESSINGEDVSVIQSKITDLSMLSEELRDLITRLENELDAILQRRCSPPESVGGKAESSGIPLLDRLDNIHSINRDNAESLINIINRISL